MRASQISLAVIETQNRLEANQPLTAGLGLRQLRKNYWEIRSSLADRIVFYRQGDLLQWILLGNHDDIRRFLSRL